MTALSSQIAVPFSVLLIDADERRREHLIERIEREALDAITCDNPSEALQILDWHRSSVAVVAPTANGSLALTTAESLRAKTPTLRVVLLGPIAGADAHPDLGSWLHVVPANDADALVLVLHRLLVYCLVEALGTREDRYRTLLDTAGNIIVHLTGDLRILDWNPAAEQLTGRRRGEVLGHGFVNRFVPERHREPVARALRDVVLTGAARIGLELPVLVRDAPNRTVMWNITLLHDADGRPGILGVGQDISARMRLEDKLREAQRLQHKITETAPEHIGLYDLERRVTVYSNHKLESMLGFDTVDFTRAFGSDFLPEVLYRDDADGAAALLRQLELESAAATQHVLPHQDGGQRVLSARHVPFERCPAGTVRQVLCLLQDVTEAEEAGQALRTSREELRQLAQHLQSIRDEERAHIAREIHDQLGQELTALKIHMSVLRGASPSLDPTMAESLTTMNELVISTSETVRRISRELHPNPTAHMGLISAIRWKVEESSQRFGFEGRFVSNVRKVRLEPNRETHLVHILQEALTNVARHAEASKVEVELDRQDDDLVLTIADDGRGISEGTITERKSIGMTGMRERAHLCGGELTIFCAPGTGTIIVVRLPIDVERANPKTGTFHIMKG